METSIVDDLGREANKFRLKDLGGSLNEARIKSDSSKVAKDLKKLNKYEVDGADEKSHEIFKDEEKEEDGIGMIEEDELVAVKKVVSFPCQQSAVEQAELIGRTSLTVGNFRKQPPVHIIH